jgi:hypothetical protein
MASNGTQYWLNGLVVPVKSIEPEIVIYQIVPSLILVLLQDIQKDI